jgi:HSP20 family protein
MTNALTRPDHLPGINRWGETMDQFFQDFFRASGEPSANLLAPALDVAEDEASLTVTAELPGLERKDIEVSVQDGVLVLRGEKRMDSESKDRKFHRIERRYGSIYRALALPDTVDAARIDARFKDGVLRLVLPKRPETKPRTVEIRE